MTFVQIVDCRTDREAEFGRLMDQWAAQTEGKRTATHATVGRDRSDSHHIVEIVEFPSYEAAMRNSKLPETNTVFEKMAELCEEPPKFTDLDVVLDTQLNKASARRIFEDVMNQRNYDALTELLADDYVDHDPALPEDSHGIDEVMRNVRMYTDAFDDLRVEIDHQMAEGDGVFTAWTCRGTHTGDFMGKAPTGREVTVSGTTAHRFGSDGKMREGWWHWDTLGLMRRLGVVDV